MDIGMVSSALSQTQLQTDISIGVLKQSLNTTEKLGEGMIKMMEQSVNPDLGQNIDIKV